MGGSNTRPYRHWARLALLVSVLLLPAVGTPTQAEDALDPVLGPAEHTYPDLQPDVTTVNLSRDFIFDPVSETFVQDPTTPPDLYFDTRSQNVGDVPLELLAEKPDDLMNSSVTQCVSWADTPVLSLVTDDKAVCRERATVGGFSYHDASGHNHFHFDDFADYELRTFNRKGQVDWSSRGLLKTSEKVSF